MATRKSNGATAAAAPPTELAIQAATPQPTMVTAPDAIQFLQLYQQQVARWTGFVVTDDKTYIEAGQGFQQVGTYIDGVETAFEKACAIPYKAWKAMTDLRGMFANPAKLIKDSLGSQQLSFRQRKEDARIAEERRLQREEQARVDREQEILRQQLEAESRRKYEEQLAAAQELADSKAPWEDDEDIPMPAAPEPVVMLPVEVAEVRLPSTVPVLAGIQPRKLPWVAKVTDLKAMVIWIGKQCEAGDDRWLSLLEPDMTKLNALAKDHTTLLAQLIPGVSGFQGETQARR